MGRRNVNATITDRQWSMARNALREGGDRFADLVASVADANLMATKEWSIAETAAHVVGIASSYTVMICPGATSSAGYDFVDLAPGITMKAVADLNEATLLQFGERTPAVLARQLRSAVDDILARCDGEDPNAPVSWLAGSQVPLAGVLAHLVNELLIHGDDIARAAGRDWSIPSWQAALFLDLFLVGVVRTGPGRLLDADDVPARRIAVEFRSRYTTTVTLVLGDGRLRVDGPDSSPDVRVFFEPAMLNLVMFRRRNPLRAMLTGRLVVWGRRPWLLSTFLGVLRMP